MPVYLWSEGRTLRGLAPLIAIAVVAVLAGTLAGRAILGRIPPQLFKKIVSALVLLLGISLLFRKMEGAGGEPAPTRATTCVRRCGALRRD